MVIDTSALLTILLDEAGAEAVELALASDPTRLVSAASALEAMIVVEARFGEPGGRELDLLLHKAQIDIVAFDAGQLETARAAFRRFGKGRHSAGLNFGDCFSYALARTSGEPLLFVGKDFSRTDIVPVLSEPGPPR
ncbi:MAG: Ribonuclease VapC [Thermoanaerobaculia bacterium]|nr:Ribonuclease VapC [Thermoanaerobaculia bacterium]